MSDRNPQNDNGTRDRTSKWGETVDDTSRPGKIRLVLADKEVEADTIEEARVRLAYVSGVERDGPADPIWLERYHQTYYEKKIVDYTAFRADLVRQRDATKDEKERERLVAEIAVVDEKLTRFAALTAPRDRERER